MIVATIDVLRKYAPEFTGGVTWSTIESLVKTVIREEIYPIFSKSITDGASGELKNLLEEAACNLVAFRKSKRQSINITGSGLQKFEGENFTSPYKYQVADYRDETLLNAYQAIESALQLALNDSTFKDTPQYDYAIARFVNFTSEIRTYRLDFLTFRNLYPHLELVENVSLKPLLTASLYNDLKSNQYKTNLSATKKALLRLIREGLAMYAVQLALEMNTVQIQGNQVFVKELKQDDAMHQSSQPRGDLYNIAMRTRREFAELYFAQVHDYLTENATDLGWSPTISEIAQSSSVQIGIKSF